MLLPVIALLRRSLRLWLALWRPLPVGLRLTLRRSLWLPLGLRLALWLPVRLRLRPVFRTPFFPVWLSLRRPVVHPVVIPVWLRSCWPVIGPAVTPVCRVRFVPLILPVGLVVETAWLWSVIAPVRRIGLCPRILPAGLIIIATGLFPVIASVSRVWLCPRILPAGLIISLTAVVSGVIKAACPSIITTFILRPVSTPVFRLVTLYLLPEGGLSSATHLLNGLSPAYGTWCLYHVARPCFADSRPVHFRTVKTHRVPAYTCCITSARGP